MSLLHIPVGGRLKPNTEMTKYEKDSLPHLGNLITESPRQQATAKKERRNRTLSSDSANQDEGAWLQQNDYKIQKQNGFTGQTSVCRRVDGGDLGEKGRGYRTKAGVTSQ